MTNAQLYLAVGVPIVVNAIFNGMLFLVVFQRMNRIEDKLDLLTGAVNELDKRITKVEIKLGIQP